MKKAKKKYREMIESVQPFEQRTRYISNIILASILGGIYLSLDEKPDIEKMTVFTRELLMNNCIMLKVIVSEKNYTPRDRKSSGLQLNKAFRTAILIRGSLHLKLAKALWNEYTATFKTCGILHLYRMWEIEELTPAMSIKPLIYKAVDLDAEVTERIIQRMRKAAAVPFYIPFAVFCFAVPVILVIAMVNGFLTVSPLWLLNTPLPVQIFAALPKKLNNRIFFDFPYCCGIALGMSGYAVIVLLNLI